MVGLSLGHVSKPALKRLLLDRCPRIESRRRAEKRREVFLPMSSLTADYRLFNLRGVGARILTHLYLLKNSLDQARLVVC